MFVTQHFERSSVTPATDICNDTSFDKHAPLCTKLTLTNKPTFINDLIKT